MGQSTTVTPWAVMASSILRTNGTPMVQVFTSSFIFLPAVSPFGPKATASNAASVGRDTNTVSQRSARSFGDSARAAWRSNKVSMAASRMS